MKRSQINHAIKRAMGRMKEYKISLPCFGYWTKEDWENQKDISSRLRERMLG